MPPSASTMKTHARERFRSFAIRIPMDWQGPQDACAARQYNHPGTFAPGERVVAVPPDLLFVPESANKYHVEAAQTLSQQFGSFIDEACQAICSAWAAWQSAALLLCVDIQGPVGSGGRVSGPDWAPIIMGAAPKSDSGQRYFAAIASAIATAWSGFQSSLSVPGLPFYPAFATVPVSVAPPIVNLPVPLQQLAHNATALGKAALAAAMAQNLASPSAVHHAALLDSLATAFAKSFDRWLATTQVTQVLGTGPVPSFPIPGPVVQGLGNMLPGGFADSP